MAGRLTRKTLPGGISQSYIYDAANRLTQTLYQKTDGSLIDQLDLAYDNEGNITGKKLANGSLSLDTAMTAQFDVANRMTSITVNGKTYALAYDANGNLTSKQNTADPLDKTLYAWDARNRLVRLVTPLPAGEGQGARESTYAYDPLGRRIERTINGETTSYLYDGNQAIGEVRAGQTTMLLTGLAIDEAIARYAPTGRLTQFTDQLGSVIKQIDAAGTTQSSTAYSPYGEATTTGDDQGNSTEYTARENDDTGLYFYRARYYDPLLKRWLSEDPIGVAGGINLYEYVGGNPISLIDPMGLEVTMTCRALGNGVSKRMGTPKHCSVFVWHWETDNCGNRYKKIDSQFSLPGLSTQPTSDSNNQTFLDDRAAFNNPGGNNENHTIPPPTGKTQQQFDRDVQNEGNNYSAPFYDPTGLAGPNSNSAANEIIEMAGGNTPNIPGAVGQYYWNIPYSGVPR